MPPTFQINIRFDNAALQRIYAAGQSVTIVSAVSSYVAGLAVAAPAQPVVAWLVFKPFQGNQVTWNERPSFYATVTQPVPPAVILINAKSSPADPGWRFTLAQGHFTGDSGEGTTYNAANQMSGYNLYFGLVQPAVVNGAEVAGPLNAVPVLFGQQAMFTPQNKISIFLSSASQNGAVIPGIPASALTFQPTFQATTVNFNDASNTFYLAGNGSSATEAS